MMPSADTLRIRWLGISVKKRFPDVHGDTKRAAQRHRSRRPAVTGVRAATAGAVVSAGNQPVRQHGQSQVAELADSAMNADLGVMRIMGLPATPSMPNDGDLLARRTNANHLARLAFGVIPCDKYNHCGGEGRFRITARTLFGWPPSPPTESQIHLEEKPHLLPPKSGI
jgi:hypothetical protein